MNTMSTPSQFDDASQTLLLAEPSFLIGKFKVMLEQIKPHPHQRLLSEDWVIKLHARFVELGVDRAAHPVKVLIHDQLGVLSENGQQSGSMQSVPELPNSISCFVYHGQHRLAACGKLEDPEEHWWYAEVYNSDLEKSHPAEFLTLMHSSNECEFRYPVSDADRFIAMYRLLQLYQQGLVNKDTYMASQMRLERLVPKDGIKQGLKNLLRSPELADSISVMLERSHLRSCFNATTWGKKLVKGRFYAVSVGLITEMMEQCRLLQGDSEEYPVGPYKLSAQSCSWSNLESSVKRKGHVWADLKGGAQQALARIRARPPTFVHLMNPKGTDGWMLGTTVHVSPASSIVCKLFDTNKSPKACLPSVLTSDLVAAALGDMYQLGQHLIHMIAGPARLERYTSNQAHEAEEDHPHGIILMVLHDLLRGKPNSNYPVKIINFMWVSRAVLLAELKAQHIAPAPEVLAPDYQTLINTSRPWWELLSLFKLRRFDRGLGLSVPKQFVDIGKLPGSTSQDEDSPPLEQSSMIYSTSPLSLRSQQRAAQSSPIHAPTLHQQLNTPPHANAYSNTNTGDYTNKPDRPEVSDGEVSRESPWKRRRVERSCPEGDRSPVYTPNSPPSVNTPVSDNGSSTTTEQRNLLGPNGAATQLKQLEAIIPDLNPDEALALEGLLAHVSHLHKTRCMARVLGTVNQHLPVSDSWFQSYFSQLSNCVMVEYIETFAQSKLGERGSFKLSENLRT
ncbi:hypothetical protein FRC06_002432 [Ceratobasidium sp. 370]|nr:hypothetical protein FRC06_002432 [Ceratobasidium sp. 370]